MDNQNAPVLWFNPFDGEWNIYLEVRNKNIALKHCRGCEHCSHIVWAVFFLTILKFIFSNYMYINLLKISVLCYNKVFILKSGTTFHKKGKN